MIILISILIIVVLLIIRENIMMEPVIRKNSFGNPDYDAKFVVITIILKTQMTQEIYHNIQDVFYIHKQLSLNDAKTYIMKHKELYSKDLNEFKTNFKDINDTDLMIKDIRVEIQNCR